MFLGQGLRNNDLNILVPHTTLVRYCELEKTRYLSLFKRLCTIDNLRIFSGEYLPSDSF